jgi:hypothetical protein
MSSYQIGYSVGSTIAAFVVPWAILATIGLCYAAPKDRTAKLWAEVFFGGVAFGLIWLVGKWLWLSI